MSPTTPSTQPQERPTVLLETFGCKANRYDTWAMIDRLGRAGYRAVERTDRPDWVVVNTCTVTAEADRQARQKIRSLKKRHPNARIAVTGCFAQVDPESAAMEGLVDLVIDNGAKFDLAQHLTEWDSATDETPLLSGDLFAQRELADMGLGGDRLRTRAVVKIQDGCDRRCAFCIIPKARGRSRSATADAIVDEVNRWVASGAPEAALTAIHLGDYGDRPGALAELCRRIEAETDLRRLRLSSLDPNEFDEPLLAFIAESKILCDHFHIPLQSGSDNVLRKMRRDYPAEAFPKIARRLKALRPNASIGADMIAGFPGESEAEFRAGAEMMETSPVDLLHVFPYSPRAGTSAVGLPQQIDRYVIKERAALLREIGQRKKRSFYQSQVGQTLEAVIEKSDAAGALGTSRNYVPVHLDAPQPESAVIRVTPTRADERGVYA